MHALQEVVEVGELGVVLPVAVVADEAAQLGEEERVAAGLEGERLGVAAAGRAEQQGPRELVGGGE